MQQGTAAMGTARTTGVRAGGRLRALDGLRFAAAAAVVAFHYTGRDNPAWAESVRQVFPTLSRFTIYGGFGPYLFFMISGFVVLMSAWGRPAHSFVASRVGRLYPAYWVAVLLTAGVLLLAPDVVPVWERLGLPGVALNLTMVQSAFGVGDVDGVYWTLWVELQFYLLVVLLALAGITRHRVLLLCLAWPVLGALARQADAQFLVGLLQPDYAPFFCLGVLLYLVYRDGWSGSVALLLGLNYCIALWICSAHYIPWSVAVAGAPVSFRGLAALLTLCVGALAVVTLTPVARLDWRWLTVLGALTYPLYLLHQNIGWVLISALAPRLPAHVVLAVVVSVVLLLAYGVHRVVERPWGPRLRAAVERDLARALPGAAPAEPATPGDTVVLTSGGRDARRPPAPRLPDPRLLPRHPVPPGRRVAEAQKTERHSRERSSAR